MSRPLGILPSQLVKPQQKRMTNDIFRLTSALARNIDVLLASEGVIMPTDLLNEWRRRLSDTLFRYSESIAREGVKFILDASQRKSEGLELVMSGIRFRLRGHSTRQAELIEEYLRQRIGQHIENGLTVSEARAALRRILKTKGYADRIAKTEAHIAVERGAYEAARSLGVRITKEWVSREDAGVRPDHEKAHGQRRELDSTFLVGNTPMLYPGDPTAPAKQLVHCRCTVNYRLE